MTATGAFATIILERLLDTLTVLVLLASFVFVFGKDLAAVNPTGFAHRQVGRRERRGVVSTSALVVLFVPGGTIRQRLGRAMARASSRRCRRRSPGLIAKHRRRSSRAASARSGGQSRAADRAGVVVSVVAVHLRSASGRWRWRFASRCRSPDRSCCSSLLVARRRRCRRPARSAGFTKRFASARRCSTARRTMRRSARRSCCTCSRSAPRFCSACSSPRRKA